MALRKPYVEEMGRCFILKSFLETNICVARLQAIQNPGDLALQEKAWNAVCPLVAKLKRFYEFSLRLGEHGYIQSFMVT